MGLKPSQHFSITDVKCKLHQISIAVETIVNTAFKARYENSEFPIMLMNL